MLLRLKLPNPNKIFYKKPKKSRYRNKLAHIMGVSVETINQMIKKKGESDCILWDLLQDFILEHLGEDRASNVFALEIYSLVIFSRVLEHVRSL